MTDHVAAKGQVPLQMSAEYVRTYNAQAHEAIDAIAAAVLGAQAALNWLRTDPPDLKEARQSLDDIVGAGKQAAEIIVRLRALTVEASTQCGLAVIEMTRPPPSAFHPEIFQRELAFAVLKWTTATKA